MVPLRIDWTFTTPVVVNNDYLQHLDALVAFAVCEEAKEFGASNAIELSQDLSHIFAQHESANGSVWKASALLCTPSSATFNATMVRRTEHWDYIVAQDSGLLQGRGRKVIDSGSGSDRNYFIYHPYQWLERAQAWCIADEDELREALGRIQAIGKLTRNGFGRIKDMTVVRDEEAYDRWKFRVLPLETDGAKGIDYVLTRQCLQPPYWERRSAVPALEPVIS